MLETFSNYLNKLFKKNKLDINKLASEGIKIADNMYIVKTTNDTMNKWNKKRRKKDKVEKIINKDGVYFKPRGRDGTIYYVKNRKICEIYFEMSGVKEYDILINRSTIKNWNLPEEVKLNSVEIEEIILELKQSLIKKRIKVDI